MAHFRTAHPGHTRSLVQQSAPGHRPAPARPQHGRAPVTAVAGRKAKGRHRAAPAVVPPSAADIAALATYARPTAFDRIKLREGFLTQFGNSQRFDSTAIPPLEQLVGFMEADSSIADIRWMAYMLATAYWETTSLKKETVPTLDKKGQPLRDKKGQPLVHSRQRWAITMAPVEEVGHGAGRNYFLPVKVKALPGGEARVTEQDGDQFTVSAKGLQTAISKGARMGAAATQKAVKTYADDDGTELSYFGRGYVQLTWWSNYARASAQLGLGLQLLLDPAQVLQPAIAYQLMAHGMRTGEGFANGRKFSNYFNGAKTDYVKARAMVNGSDHAADIAAIARQFEIILLAAKP
ncbi:hypothetical protein [Rhodanobacter sp. KK11]|uniref:hypothetical protein n=1 Tax=Rhodanobacter sp. KK11 TaxID=3083255 RepID=UPI002966CAC9|nr:hypothetical protein [Rhodanobacter sp. KK11]MDW2982819.1 hypothetical protein [Rhodanobacter sp. KK11]